MQNQSHTQHRQNAVFFVRHPFHSTRDILFFSPIVPNHFMCLHNKKFCGIRRTKKSIVKACAELLQFIINNILNEPKKQRFGT